MDEQQQQDGGEIQEGRESDSEGRDPETAPTARDFQLPEATSGDLPDWCKVPANLEIPKGAPVGFLRFMPLWTMASHLGERQCIVWPLTDIDERIAYARIKDNFANAGNELAKQMLRAIDGVRVNWGARSGDPSNPHDFWRDIGPGCRKMVIAYYNRSHSLEPAQIAFFTEHCVALRTMG